ncbi:MAG: ammonium transporter [Ruminococcus sp.]|nr:ammonium transporter [Ruminococcus sp.]MDD6635528.1 ammonium transporter [Ruminococcus sp.]MDY3215295.1 ammonium transporter [Ruminococcus sp.]MDY3844398.1 ammonium transporter [Ruminococcus sp.]
MDNILSQVLDETSDMVFGIWFLIGAALVFFMQAGFAMVETGFTRAKNAGNIIMKNLMDFCIGTVMFIVIGFGLLLGEDFLGFIGKPGFDILTAYKDFNWSSFVFNLVFCATTATIVSGAMAERTKFLSYCVYSAVISALIYPIEAHWIWGGGWLAQLGFHDYAGSTAIHMVGGIAALVGAKILGPRIGKFTKTKDGEIKVHAIPGHNLTIGALGCFILWFGWYGFNGAAATNTAELGSIFLATTVAPAVATVTCMIFTWLKYGKPDVSMCLNASLAGLVGVTAPCDVVDCTGSFFIGVVSGLLVCFGVWLLDYKLHIDDPVGAVAVHMMNGIWGTLAVGLFATKSAPGYATAVANGVIKGEGLFYGGGFTQLGLQLLGFVSVGAWAFITMIIVFLAIKKTIGLRASEQEEIIGLDVTEHGLVSSYADFAPAMNESMYGYTKDDAKSVQKVSVEQAVEVQSFTANTESKDKMTKIVAVFKQSKLQDFISAMEEIDVTGITVTNVLGCGVQKGQNEYYRGAPLEVNLLPKVKAEIVVCSVPVNTVVNTARKVLYTGHIGDGKIFIYDVENVIKVRTGEQAKSALLDEKQ